MAKFKVVIAALAFLMFGLNVNAMEKAVDEEPFSDEMYQMIVTCYYAKEGSLMANQQPPYYGCVATSKHPDIYNRTVLIYERDSDTNAIGKCLFIGEARDTGGKSINTPTPEEEKVIDCYITDESQMIPTQPCWVQVITAAG